jgi:hypothetical protein
MQTLESGDLFERTHASWLRSRLPSYEQVWSTFIGNDGCNQQLDLGLSHDKESERKRFAQAHYSFALSAFQIDRIANSALEEKFPVKPSLEQYLAGYETLFLFIAYIGHVRDMLKQMEDSLAAPGELSTPFRDYYAQRSHVIHGPQFPIALDEISWLIPRFAGTNEHPGDWGKNPSWNNVAADRMQYALDFIRATRTELFSMICLVHPKVFAVAKRFFEGHQMVWPDKSALGIAISAGSASFKISASPSGLSDGSGFMPFAVD